jgi:hypothetical protein
MRVEQAVRQLVKLVKLVSGWDWVTWWIADGAVAVGPRRTSRFVEVADGRVSRIHCTVKTQKRDGALGVFDVCIEDCSSNGVPPNILVVG